MTLLDVVVDESRIACGGVQAFPKVFEEDPYEHRTNGQPHHRETESRLRLRCSRN